MHKVVFTNGVFDILHPGHLNILVRCRCLAGKYGKVVVGIDNDIKVRKDKGPKRPYFSESERSSNLLSLKYPSDSTTYRLIDEVRFFETNEELYNLIKFIKPTYLVKGADWKNNVVGSDLAEVILVEKEIGQSSTNIERRILNKEEK